MSKSLLNIFFLLLPVLILGQGQKMPDFSFKHNSTEFANANMRYSDRGQYEEVVEDHVILFSLVKILSANEALLINVEGHRDKSESLSIPRLRAEYIQERLIEAGIDSARISVVNKDTLDPALPFHIEKTLDTAIEMEAARQKNRRVKITVTGKIPEE